MKDYLIVLREEIIKSFESLEDNHKFERTKWDHHSGGGGEMAVLRGDVFEKAAVNFSEVKGKKFPGSDGKGPYYATGISLITHMKNPKMPTVHFNLRYIEAGDEHWIGGGYDLTPMGFPNSADTQHFHRVAKNSLGEELYNIFSEQAKEYFYIPHRKKERGVGGIFFDHYNTGDYEKDFKLLRNVGSNFLPAIMPIYKKRKDEIFSDEDKHKQLKLRAHYVEFNLLYDRGTQFGFKSGGNPEAILCSMPPLASW